MATTRVQLCGPLVIERDGGRLDGALPGRQGRLVFAYLVLNRRRPVPRDELLAALWPEGSPAATDSALNALLSKLRRVLGASAVDGRGGVRLRIDPAWIDVEAAFEAIHRAESAVALHSYDRAWGPSLVALFTAERELLPGEDLDWIVDRRRDMRELQLRALEAYAGAGLGIGGTELAAAIRAARRLVALAPLRESGYCVLMRALAAQGNAAEALQVYGSLCEALRDELGASPSPPTRDVYDELLRIT